MHKHQQRPFLGKGRFRYTIRDLEFFFRIISVRKVSWSID